MSEILRNDQIALRTCILYEFVEGKSIWEAYEHFCKVMGRETMEYKDFEYWFMRFSSGKHDLNYDRSLDPKTRSLSDMPVNVIEHIFDKLELPDRFIFRKVSKNFQTLVDNYKTGVKTIKISGGYFSIGGQFNGKNFCYKNNFENLRKKDECMMKYNERIMNSKSENTHLELALDDLAGIFKNSKLRLNSLEVESYRKNDNIFKKFESIMKSIKTKIYTKSVTITTRFRKGEMSILPYLESETLEEIVLKLKDRTTCIYPGPPLKVTKIRMDQFVHLDQWKNAKMRTIETEQAYYFPIECFLECSHFNIYFDDGISARQVLRYKQTLLESTVLEVFNLTSGENIPLAYTRKLLDKNCTQILDRNIRRYPFTNSNDFLQIELAERSVRFERTS